MRRFLRTLASAAIVAGVTATLLAQGAPELSIKYGLWEISSTMNMTGAMSQMDTSKMTPEQKAQIEAAIKQMGSKPQVAKNCITKDDLSKRLFQGEKDATCTGKYTTNTKAALEIEQTCTSGERNETMTGSFHAATSTTMTGKIHVTSVESGKTTTVDATLSGKWLAADCGNIK